MVTKTLFEIAPENISPNPNNPRLFFDPEGMDELRKSIDSVGILVPLTIYENHREIPKTKYILLDGERRLRVARELNLPTVPANIIDEPKDIVQNILFMFNIHHYRKEWELFPTALKLEVVIKSLGTDNESVLNQFTGVNRSTIRRCKILLWFPKKYREVLLNRTGRISTDFFIELYPIVHRLCQEPEYYYPEGVEKLVDRLIDIFTEGKVISDVKEFRDIRRSMGYYNSANKFDVFEKMMSEFLDNPEVQLGVFASPELEADQARRNILRYISFLSANLREINPDVISDWVIVEQLENLRSNIEEILLSIE